MGGDDKRHGGMDVMMGDLVLTQDEVNPVMSALLDNGLEVTALHNHFFWDEPRIFYMHVHGHGTPAELARKLKPAVDLIGKGAAQPAAAAPAPAQRPAAKIDTAKIAQIVGTQGEQTGDVYKITIGRDDLKLTEMGAPINARMGLNTWAAFVGTNDKAAIAGDVAMLASEVHAGPEGAAQEWSRRRRDPSPHDRRPSRPSSSCITGARVPAEKLATGFQGGTRTKLGHGHRRARRSTTVHKELSMNAAVVTAARCHPGDRGGGCGGRRERQLRRR